MPETEHKGRIKVDSGKIDFDLKGIGQLLAQEHFRVPIYQRSYSWGDDQLTDYWSDLTSAFSTKDPEYFLGTIVLTREESSDRLTVIDGQQRLATTAIMLSVVRDLYLYGDEEDQGRIVQRDFLGKAELGSSEEIPRIVMNSDDDVFFRSAVIASTDPAGLTPTQDSHKLMKQALVTFEDKLKIFQEDAGKNWTKALLEWVRFVKDSVRVITVTVPTESDAFLIFETLNDRGADLTIADLLKNYLFGLAGERLDVVRDGWMSTLGALELSTGSPLFTMFLRHFWSSKHGLTRERELYKRIKEQVTTETQAVEFITQAQKAATLYAALLNSDHEFWSTHGTETRDNVETILRLDLLQNRPLVLAAMQHFDEKELRRLLRAIVAWSVRSLIVGGLGGGSFETAYCRTAVKIRDGEVKSSEKVLIELSGIVPSDKEFLTEFSVAKVQKAYLARYYLAALEKGVLGKSEPELVPNRDEQMVNLEHILPKNATSKDWGHFSTDERRGQATRLGNMTLLSKGPNGRIGNKSFKIKKPILLKSELKLTVEAGEAANWTSAEIEKRQIRLATLAVKVWPREP